MDLMKTGRLLQDLRKEKGLTQEQLSRAMFPIGAIQKREVRDLARKYALPVAEKKDSTGICFIGERNFKRFLMTYLPACPGDMVDEHGKKIGRHDGLMYYTLGQRRGLGIGGCGDGRSWFVIDKDLQKNKLIVAQGEDHKMLYSTDCIATGTTWIGEPPMQPGEVLRCEAHFRYRQPDQPVEVRQEGDKLLIHALTPQRAVTPGQSAVLYLGEKCLGGAVVEKVLNAGV